MQTEIPTVFAGAGVLARSAVFAQIDVWLSTEMESASWSGLQRERCRQDQKLSFP
ncbi:hypothetical protein M2322_004885 [Rhodoblastus acidophilus]|uniref:hypothetical protein n=1 Tax=Rhodoblastus acidophilus TaxID=1074 RepID=UPI00222412CE|nr:hypothetical protein [Rhodoblastus acidophilus]MCW2319310.1 hypothetical protein [Rhodoblastus acidophilus]